MIQRDWTAYFDPAFEAFVLSIREFPTKPAALQLGADGQLVVQTPNGWPRTLALSGDAKSHAQELVQLLASRPAVIGTTPAMSFSR